MKTLYRIFFPVFLDELRSKSQRTESRCFIHTDRCAFLFIYLFMRVCNWFASVFLMDLRIRIYTFINPQGEISSLHLTHP